MENKTPVTYSDLVHMGVTPRDAATFITGGVNNNSWLKQEVPSLSSRDQSVSDSEILNQAELADIERSLIKDVKVNPRTHRIKSLYAGGRYLLFSLSFKNNSGKTSVNIYEGGPNDGLFYIHHESPDKQADIVRVEPGSVLYTHFPSLTGNKEGDSIPAKRSPDILLPEEVFKPYSKLLNQAIAANKASLLELQIKEV